MTIAERDNLALSCYRLAGFLAKRWAGSVAGMDVSDLAQEAQVEILECAQKFDPLRQVKFSAFARHCILDRFRFLKNTEGTVRLKWDYGKILAEGRRRLRRGESIDAVCERIASEKCPVQAKSRWTMRVLLRRDLRRRARTLRAIEDLAVRSGRKERSLCE